jgi:rhodanese-related sulfurtransferase
MGLFSRRSKNYAEVDAAEAIELVAGGALLVDVRTGLEFNNGHAAGARHIPLEQVGRRSGELPADAQLVVICQSGHRSALAARTLAKRGITVSSVLGGTPAWKRAGGAMDAPGSEKTSAG